MGPAAVCSVVGEVREWEATASRAGGLTFFNAEDAEGAENRREGWGSAPGHFEGFLPNQAAQRRSLKLLGLRFSHLPVAAPRWPGRSA